MSHYAHINQENIVDNVIVADQEFINTGLLGNPIEWIQTSYNTRGGIHYGQDGLPDGGIQLRKNYSGIGYTYDLQRDAFISPKPFESWILNEDSCLWESPIPYPNDGLSYSWNESTISWEQIIEGTV